MQIAEEQDQTRPRPAGSTPFRPLKALWLLTPAVFAANGYHPFADDGAIYVAQIKRLLHPDLFPHDSAFVLASAHMSLFGPILAALVARTHLPLDYVLLACHLGSIFFFLYAAARVAEVLFSRQSARWGALLAAAACFTLPVAGTALFVMDPYVTARSFSTPAGLMALAACLEGRWRRAGIWLTGAALFHPLMAAYAALMVLTVGLVSRRRFWAVGLAAGAGFLISAALYLATRDVPLTTAASQAALSRSYFFLSSWQWYEYPGVALPLLLLAWAAWRMRGKRPAGALAAACFFVGFCALAISGCFVHRSGSLLLARLQVLRSFHILYLSGILLAGGWIGLRLEKLNRGRGAIAGVLCMGVFLAMYAGQRATYPDSNPVEWPWVTPRNPWEQAFLWVRSYTPVADRFALDAGYTRQPGEDAQGFRAIAERGTLADWYKDGGIASEFREAQEPWWSELHRTEGLDRLTDPERLSRLQGSGASWILLPKAARTTLPCPFENRAVRICRLPQEAGGAGRGSAAGSSL